jgi:hypothetical protein
MRTTVDEEVIARSRRVGQVANFIGVTMVFVGLVVSFTPWKTMTVMAIVIGVAMYTVGTRGLSQADREVGFVRQLEEGLTGLDDRYHLYSHVMPADHVLVTPYGVFVLIVKDTEGRVRCYRDKWVRDWTVRQLLRFFTDEPLGNPTKDARKQAEKMLKYMEEESPQAIVDVEGLVLFANPKARLEVTGAILPVMPLRRLKPFLRKAAKKQELPAQTMEVLTALFDRAATG